MASSVVAVSGIFCPSVRAARRGVMAIRGADCEDELPGEDSVLSPPDGSEPPAEHPLRLAVKARTATRGAVLILRGAPRQVPMRSVAAAQSGTFIRRLPVTEFQ